MRDLSRGAGSLAQGRSGFRCDIPLVSSVRVTLFSYLVLGATYAFAAAVQPGQLQAYLISQTFANGWRRTLPAALSPLVSDLPIVSLVLLLLTQVPDVFVRALQAAGGLFLLYLASGAVRACRTYRQSLSGSAAGTRQTMFKAALVNLLNPNPYLAWALVLGPLLLGAWRQSPLNGIAFVAAFYLTMVAATAAIIVLFGTARSFGPRAARVLVGASAAALAAFGLYQLWTGAAALVARVP